VTDGCKCAQKSGAKPPLKKQQMCTEIGIVIYPESQMAAVQGLTDLFRSGDKCGGTQPPPWSFTLPILSPGQKVLPAKLAGRKAITDRKSGLNHAPFVYGVMS
jgi:transcriptional regulator GlxA family with amidase domain